MLTGVKLKWILTGVAVLVAAIILLAGGGWWSARQFLQSDRLRRMLATEISKHTGVEGELMGLRLEGWTLRSMGFEGRGLPGGAVRLVRAEDLQWRLAPSALWRRVWGIEEIRAGRVEIHAGAGLSPEKLRPPSPPPDGPLPWHAALLPREVEIARVVVDRIDIRWEAGPELIAHARDIRCEAGPRGAESWELRLRDGSLEWPGFPQMRLESALIMASAEQQELTEAVLSHDLGGRILLAGRVRGLEDVLLNYTMERMPLEALVPGGWSPHFLGRLEGKGQVSHAQGRTLGDGVFRVVDGRLRGLPALQPLVEATQLRDWLDIPLNEAHAELRFSDGLWDIHKLLLESSDLARIEGAFQVRDGALDGVLQVGARERAVRMIPGARSQVFSWEQGGYYWARPGMKLSGTVSEPKEDLSPRLKTAALEKVGQQVEDIIESVIDHVRPFLR